MEIKLEDVLDKFIDRNGKDKVYQTGGVVIDYLFDEKKFYFTFGGKPREMPFEEVVDFFKKEYKRYEKYYKEAYKKTCPFRN